MRKVFLPLLLLAAAQIAHAQAPEKFDWGKQRVRVSEIWENRSNWDWKNLKPGAGLIRDGFHDGFYTHGGSRDYRHDWLADAEHARGLVALFAAEVPVDSLVEVTEFGRIGNVIQLTVVLKRVIDFGGNPDANPKAGYTMPAGTQVIVYRSCLWAIERWAGRTFASDDEVAAWWESAKVQSQRHWLENSLERTGAEADAGNLHAQWLFRQMIPAAPHAELDPDLDPPWTYHPEKKYLEKTGSGRAKWLKDNKGKLKYDERFSIFAI